jgi:hypothetical protein
MAAVSWLLLSLVPPAMGTTSSTTADVQPVGELAEHFIGNPECALMLEGSPVTLRCRTPGAVVTGISYASWGQPRGACRQTSGHTFEVGWRRAKRLIGFCVVRLYGRTHKRCGSRSYKRVCMCAHLYVFRLCTGGLKSPNG